MYAIKLKNRVIALVLTLCAQQSFADATFTPLGDLPVGTFNSFANAVSGDGFTVIGKSSSLAFRWTKTNGMTEIGDLPGGTTGGESIGVSANGSVIVGWNSSILGQEAFRWTSTGGIVGLGDLPGGSMLSQANDVTADGTVVVGYSSSDRTGSLVEPFRWTASGGMIGLGGLPGETRPPVGHANAISTDGLVIVGYTSTRTTNFEAFRWTESGGMVGLGALMNAPYSSEANDVSADGSVVVGYSTSIIEGGATAFQAFRWTLSGGMVGLGDLPGGTFQSTAKGVSADGSIVVGVGRSATGDEAFIWDTQNGMRGLKDVLVNDHGLDLTGWTLTEATDVSADSSVIVGWGRNPTGSFEAWRVELVKPISPPTNLKASAGKAEVTLIWDPYFGPVDSWKIHIAQNVSGSFSDLGAITVATSQLDPGTTSYVLKELPDGSPLVNGVMYRLSVSSVINLEESAPSNEVFAIADDGGWSAPSKPEHPILFLHGIGIPIIHTTTAKTWGDTKDFLINTLGWKFGGELYNAGGKGVIDIQFRDGLFDRNADFYTATFGNDKGNYDDGKGIRHQADEVDKFIRKLESIGSIGEKIIVAHSMGGLAARWFLANYSATSADVVTQLITYGTPHLGGRYNIISDYLAFVGENIGDTFSYDGLRNMDFDCSITGQTVNSISDFLSELRGLPLPEIRYVSIVGHSHTEGLVRLIWPRERSSSCLSGHWDGAVPIDSADLRKVLEARTDLPPDVPSAPIIPSNMKSVYTDKNHLNQTSDVSGILCALDRNCAVFELRSPVDIEITSPSGGMLTRSLSAIPGGSYFDMEDETGHELTIAMIPYPQAGDFTFKVIPKPNALPTDTYSINVTLGNETILQIIDTQVADIPSDPIIVTIPDLPEQIPGDLDNDGDVDRNDLNVVLAARNTPASGPNDPRDLDSDGMITALDARKLVTLCTRPRCATG